MFGWRQLGRGLDFSLEASRRRRIFGDRRRQHLDRHDSLHAAMLGLEHLPHAAGPDLVEDGVVAQDQRFGFPGRDLLGLELGQVVCLDEFRNEFFERLWDGPWAG